MSEKKPIVAQDIIIREFKITRGNINCADDFDVEEVKSFDFSVDVRIGFNLDQKLIRVDFSMAVETISQHKVEEANSSFHFVFVFHYDDLINHTTLGSDKEVDCNPYLTNAVASITYSTARGILISRFQGTAMRDFILPVVDPNSLTAQGVFQRRHNQS